MNKKTAEAVVAYEKLSPAEKARLAREMEVASSTLPLTLAEAARLSVAPVGRPATTLGTLAPQGRPTIIAAWASWCVPCKVEARQLAALRRQYGAQGLNIVYLNIGDPKVEAAKGPEFLESAGTAELGLTMLAPADFQKLTRLQQISIPRVLPYDRNGKPRKPIIGHVVTTGSEKKAIDSHLERAAKDIMA